MSSKIKQGGTIRSLIAVLLSALVIIFIGVPNETTSTVSNIKNQVKPTLATKVVTAEPTVEKPVAAKKTKVVKPRLVEISTTHPNGCSAYDSIFSEYSWNVRVAEAICMAESGGNPDSLSPTCDRGLMQVNCVHRDMVANLSSLYSPSVNISVAWKIYSANGWQPWTTYRTGAYLKYY